MKFQWIFLFLFYFLISCESDKSNEPFVLEFKKIESITLEQTEPLFGKFFEQLVISNDGNFLLFSERIKKQIFVYKFDGNLFSVIGESGRGPSGILEIIGYDINDNGEVLIYDALQRMLKIFDIDGNLLRSVSFLENETINPTANNLNWYNNQVVTTIYDTKIPFNVTHKSSLVALIDTNGSLDKVFGKFDPFSQKDNKLTFNTVSSLDDRSGLLYTNLQTSPYVYVYSLETQKLVEKGGIQTENFKLPKKEITAYQPISQKFKLATNTSAIAHIFNTDRYVIQHMQILTNEWFKSMDYSAKKNFLNFYDKENLDFLKEIPVSFTPIGEHNNAIYVIEEFNPDNYTIGVYEIIEAE